MTGTEPRANRLGGDETLPSGMVTREDDRVGTSGTAPSGGGRQTPEQSAITDIAPGGRSDADRAENRGGGEPGRAPVAVGGASSGHADQKSADGGRSAQGHYKVEKEQP